MGRFGDNQLKARRQRRAIVAIMLTLMGVGLVVSLYMLQDVPPRLRSVDFDPQACVRMLGVSRVYTIRPNPADSGEVWFGTAEGIRVFDTTYFEWTRYGLDHGLGSETVADIAFADSTPWVATWNGLSRFNRAERTFTTFSRTSGLGGTRVLSVQCMPGYGVYCYVDGKGMHLLAPGDTLLRKFAFALL